jgi:uncharacterized membrane protein YhaH (DUF805 family)
MSTSRRRRVDVTPNQKREKQHMDVYLGVLRKYVEFSGRAKRREYWTFVLINLVISLILSFIDRSLGFASADTGIGLLSGIYSLAVFLPSLAVMVRRLHDTGRSGWWVLIGLIPFIGWIVLLIFALLDSTGDNEYGPRTA